MLPTDRSRLLLAFVGLGVLGSLCGCPRRDGCASDSDCKGDRVCEEGKCVALPTKDTAAAPKRAAATGNAPSLAPATVSPQAQPPPGPIPAPAATPGELAADGMPLEIPTPGSPPPSVAEWNAVTREITVRGSSRLNCETKMLREWLRVDCHKNHQGEPAEVVHTKQSGQQAFRFVGNGKASIVVQVVRGKEYRAEYTWNRGGAHSGAELVVSWLGGAPRPTITLAEN